MDWIVISVLLLVIAGLAVFIAKAKKKHRITENQHAALLNLLEKTQSRLGVLVENRRSLPDWSRQLGEFLMEEFKADGFLFYVHPTDQKDNVSLLSTAGDCSHWGLTISANNEVKSGETEGALEADEQEKTSSPNIPSGFYWSRKPVVLKGNEMRDWIPDENVSKLSSIMVTPLRSNRGEGYLVLIRSGTRRSFSNWDMEMCELSVALGETGFTVLAAEIERQQMEEALETAHEEGMLQISSGIIHNIGNGIAVIQLALERLRRGEIEAAQECIGLMRQEMLPTLRSQAEAGTLQQFLTEDQNGSEYLSALETMAQEISRIMESHGKEVEFVCDKFHNVTEVINLQQQFIGELGTENVCQLNSIVSEAVTMCQEALSSNNIAFSQALNAQKRILVDSGMVRNIALLMLKYAIEAAATTSRPDRIVKLETYQGPREDRNGSVFVTCTVSDNGAGTDPLPEEGHSPLVERGKVDEKVRSLLFIRRQVKKYDGIFEVKSEFGLGTKTSLHFPVYEEPDTGDASDKTS